MLHGTTTKTTSQKPAFILKAFSIPQMPSENMPSHTKQWSLFAVKNCASPDVRPFISQWNDLHDSSSVILNRYNIQYAINTSEWTSLPRMHWTNVLNMYNIQYAKNTSEWTSLFRMHWTNVIQQLFSRHASRRMFTVDENYQNTCGVLCTASRVTALTSIVKDVHELSDSFHQSQLHHLRKPLMEKNYQTVLSVVLGTLVLMGLNKMREHLLLKPQHYCSHKNT